MKTFLVALFLIALAMITAVFLHQDAGTVQINFQGGEFTAPLLHVFYGVLAAFLALYILFRLLGMIFRAPSAIGKAKDRRASEAALQRLVSGTQDLNEGQYARAEKTLTKDVPTGQAGALHYLAAAQAANAQGHLDLEARYLERAAEHHPAALFGINLSKAEKQLNNGDVQQALESCRELLKIQPRNANVIGLLGKCLAANSLWDELSKQLPELRKRSSLSEKTVNQLENDTGKALLLSVKENQLESTWKGLSSGARSNVELLSIYATRLNQSNGGDLAEKILSEAMQKNLDGALVNTYATLNTSSPDQQLSTLQQLIDQNSEDANLLSAAGFISAKQELWGKASSYLEQAATLGDNPRIQQTLALVSKSKGDSEAYRLHLQQGLELALKD